MTPSIGFLIMMAALEPFDRAVQIQSPIASTVRKGRDEELKSTPMAIANSSELYALVRELADELDRHDSW